MKISIFTKLFVKFFPKTFLKYAAIEQGVDAKKLDYADRLFRDCKRIDVQPLSRENRGFIITIDNQLSLWFVQDGDSFKFDGYEIGEYNDGGYGF